MADVFDKKIIAPGFKNESGQLRIVWDFGVDGGAASAYTLANIKRGIVVSRTIVNVLTACESGDVQEFAPKAKGKTDKKEALADAPSAFATDPVEFQVGKTNAAEALVTGIAGAVANLDDVGKVVVSTVPTKIAADQDIILTIAENDAVAGKLEFIFEYYLA